MYLNLSKIHGYNASLHFIILKRGYGKTYGFKTKFINDFLNGKGRFIWCRRNKPELNDGISKWLDDIKDKYPTHSIYIKAKKLYIDDRLAGYFVPLSTTIGKKSVPYNDVCQMCYDELIPEGGYSNYIPNEPQVFASFLMSVFRERKMKCYVLGNLETSITPYNLYFNIPPFEGNKYLEDRKILIYTSDRNNIIENQYVESDIAKVLATTDYFDYAFKNKALSDNDEFIIKFPQNCEQLMTIDISGNQVYVYADWKHGKVIIHDVGSISHTRRLSLNVENIKESYFLFTKTCVEAKFLREHIRNGRIFYTSLKVKAICIPLIKYLK